jgi:hypothetical protein
MKKPTKKLSSQQQLAWEAMRELRTFTGEELIKKANLSDEYVEKSLRYLLYDLTVAGYLKQKEEYSKFVNLKQKEYTLIKDVGELSPTLTRSQNAI